MRCRATTLRESPSIPNDAYTVSVRTVLTSHLSILLLVGCADGSIERIELWMCHRALRYNAHPIIHQQSVHCFPLFTPSCMDNYRVYTRLCEHTADRSHLPDSLYIADSSRAAEATATPLDTQPPNRIDACTAAELPQFM